jgi:hypothetical protein
MTRWTPSASFPPGHALRYQRYGLGMGTNTVEGIELLGHTGFIRASAFHAPPIRRGSSRHPQRVAGRSLAPGRRPSSRRDAYIFDVTGAAVRPDGDVFLCSGGLTAERDNHPGEDFERHHDLWEANVRPTPVHRITAPGDLDLQRT